MKEWVTSLPRQMRSLWPLLVGVYLPVFLALGLAQLLAIRDGVPLAVFTRDPLANFDGASPYLGFVSHVGVLGWCAAAAVCLFSAAVLVELRAPGRQSAFFLVLGLITLWLALDDMFQLHESEIPLWTGVSQPMVYAAYLALIVTPFVVFRKVVLDSAFLLLLLAFALLGASVLSDMLLSHRFRWLHLIEDGTKLFGIATWLGYFVHTAMAAIREAARRRA